MAIYRFRVSFEEYEDVSRDIEIRSSQTFEEFHEVILSSIGFDKKHAASFFVCDAQWRKGNEITLLEEDLEEGVRLMKKTKIAACVEDPHQQFIYVYDKQVGWSFTVQLIKILKEDAGGNYPACVKTTGTPPKQYKPLTAPKEEATEAEAGIAMLMSEMEDEEAYRNASTPPEEIIGEEDTLGLDEETEEQEDGTESEEDSGEDGEESEGYSSYQDDEH